MFNLTKEIENEKLRIWISELSNLKKYDLAYWSKEEKVLRLLFKDDDWDVRSGVAQNINTPIEILVILSKDKHKYVCVCAKNNLRKVRPCST